MCNTKIIISSSSSSSRTDNDSSLSNRNASLYIAKQFNSSAHNILKNGHTSETPKTVQIKNKIIALM